MGSAAFFSSPSPLGREAVTSTPQRGEATASPCLKSAQARSQVAAVRSPDLTAQQ